MFASARSCDLRAGRRRPAAIVTRCTGRGGSRVVHQEQRRSSHWSDFWLPRELSDEKGGAVHASDYWKKAFCREILSLPMRCRAHVTSLGILLNNGLYVLRTAKASARSTCSGNSIR